MSVSTTSSPRTGDRSEEASSSSSHDIFPHPVVPARRVKRIGRIPFTKRDWHSLACRALLFLPYLLCDKLLKANKVRYMEKPQENWTEITKLYAHFKKTCDEASQQGTYDKRYLPNWDRVEKRLDHSPTDVKSNANVRLIFLLTKHLFLVKHLFTFGQRKVKRGTVHLLQTSASPMLYFELMKDEVFNRMPKRQDKVFHPPDETCYQRYTLQPKTMYRIPANRIYVLITIKKTLFSLYVIPEGEAFLFSDAVDPTRDRALLNDPFGICPTPARQPEEEDDFVVMEEDWLPREAVSSTSSFVPPPPSDWNASFMPPPPPPPAAAVRPTKRCRAVETPPRHMDAATNTDPMEEVINYLFEQTCAGWSTTPWPSATPWPSSAAAATPGSSSPATPAPAHLSSIVAPPPPVSIDDEEATPLDLSVRGGEAAPDPASSNPSVPPPESEELVDFSMLMDSNDSDEQDIVSFQDSATPPCSMGEFLDSFTSQMASDERVDNDENHLF